jgi:hypothetical protein
MSNFPARNLVLAGLAGLSFAHGACADSVSGRFQLDGNAVAPVEVAAFRVRDQWNPREYVTYVLLSAKPVDREAIAADIDPYTAAINDDAVLHADHIAFHVKADGTVEMNAHVGGVQYVDTTGTMMGQAGSLVATCSTNTQQHIACKVKSPKAVATMDGPTWTVDMAFDSRILARTPGKPLPKDGGEPGQVLLKLVEAVEGSDFAGVTALLTPEEAASYNRDYQSPEENLADLKQMLGFTLPKQPKITGGELVDDDTALLEVEGVPYEGTRMLYLVTLQRTHGRWGYASSRPAGILR